MSNTSFPAAPPKPPPRMALHMMPPKPQAPASMPAAKQESPKPAASTSESTARGPRALPAATAATATTNAKPQAKKAARKDRIANVMTAKRVKKAATKSTASPVRKAAKAAAEKLKPTSTAPSMGKQKEIDPTKLDQVKASNRLSKIYSLEKTVERKKKNFDTASKARRASKAELEEAEEALKLEIQEQRFGPGPLWNADGSGPAGAPQADDSAAKKPAAGVIEDEGDDD